jgi:hypothetical protein
VVSAEPDSAFPCNASFLVYGPSKAGKTWLVTSGPKPTLLLDAEGGSRFLPLSKVIWSNPLSPPPDMEGYDVCVVYVRDFSTLENVFGWLHTGKHPFRSVAIDSISEAQQRCVDAIAGVNQMTQPNWGTLLRKIRGLVSNYRDLLIHPLNPLDCVAFTSYERVTQEGVHVPYLQGAIANVLSYYLDIVVYLKAEPGAGGQGTTRKLLTKPHPAFAAGDRTDRLPTIIENPTLEAVLALACDLSAAPQGGGTMPDLAATAVSDDGSERPEEAPPAPPQADAAFMTASEPTATTQTEETS